MNTAKVSVNWSIRSLSLHSCLLQGLQVTVQALHWLNQLGYTQLASAGLENLKQQLVLNRQAPDKGECHRLQVYLDPFMEAFWTRPFSDPHHIKLAGAVMEFSRRRNPRQAAGFLKDVAVYWELLP